MGRVCGVSQTETLLLRVVSFKNIQRVATMILSFFVIFVNTGLRSDIAEHNITLLIRFGCGGFKISQGERGPDIHK